MGIVCLAVAGCGSPDGPPEEASRVPEQVRGFDGYELYSVGDSFGELPLEDVVRGPGGAWSFIYGDCTPPAGEGGCAPPLEIQNWSICDRFPALYGGSNRATPSVDGARELPAGGGLDVYTGRTTVVIFGRDRKEVLRNLRLVGSTDEAPLPPPAPGSLAGKLRCQQSPSTASKRRRVEAEKLESSS